MRTCRPLCLILGTALVAGLGWSPNCVATSMDTSALVTSNNAFALALYGRLGSNEGNVFFSPYSISTCLGMTYAGARGATEQQMAQALSFSTNQSQLGHAFGALQKQLNGLSGRAGIDFTIANGLWAQQGHAFLPDFLGNATSNYQAVLKQANFPTEAESVRGEINQWVADKTKGVIVNLLAPGMVDQRTRLVLVNAIYFKGAWASKFSTNATTVQPFQITSSQTVNVPLMYQTESVGYYQDGTMQAVELPYKGTNLTMVVLLPTNPSTLGQLEASLTPHSLAQIFTNLVGQPVDVFLPKFKMEMTTNLIPALQSLGMIDAFVPKVADFSGMDGTNDLYIDKVVHKASVEVDENGTVAAAATGVVIPPPPGISEPPTVFRADHPFLFCIRDTQSGAILFIGRVADPTVGGGTVPPAPSKFQASSYNGLFYDSNAVNFQSSGALTLTLSASGKFTGKIQLAGKSYSFTGQFYAQADSATVIIRRTRMPDLTVTLQILDSGGTLSGLVSDGNWTAVISGDRLTGGYSTSHPTPQAGTYTMTLLGTNDDGTLSPGYGSIGHVTAAANGSITLSGTLSDGMVFSQAATLSTNGDWPMYVSLYGGKGSLLGWINFARQPASRFNGTVSWIKTGAYGTYYASGFTNTVTALGSIIRR